MGVDVSLKNVEEKEMLFTKIVTISPRYIVVNEAKETITITQVIKIGEK